MTKKVITHQRINQSHAQLGLSFLLPLSSLIQISISWIMPRNKHALFSKHKNKNSRSRLSSATATDQLRRFSRKAKPNNTGESDQEEMPGNNSDNNSEEPEDSHVAQVLRNITGKGKGSSTLARKAVVASIKASSASSSKLSKAKEETNRTKSSQRNHSSVKNKAKAVRTCLHFLNCAFSN